MAETTFPVQQKSRTKFIVGGLLLLAAVAYLIFSTLLNQQEYFITVNELTAQQEYYASSERNIRISGAVLGESIEYTGEELSFTIVHIPTSTAQIEDEGGLAEALHQAVTNPDAERLTVVMYDEAKPELLQHEAQAIVTGRLGEDGVFYADELLLKCPTRYEEAVPEQADLP